MQKSQLSQALPQPDVAAQAASQQLVSLIKQEIHLNNDWISFARYMELALYAPQLGYYTGGSTKLGQAGDFTTAPELSSLFGGALAHFAMQTSMHQIMEFGAGTGKLAADILTEMHQQGRAPAHYYIVELSGELRYRQQQCLKDFPEVVWLQHMPETFSGLVLGNEVLDAMPVQLVKKTASGWNEVGVCWQQNGFGWAERALVDTSLIKQIPAVENLPVGYLTEVSPIAQGFTRSVSRILQRGKTGLMVLIDYGFPAAEYYLPQRHQGTLMCHYRHHAHTDPFYWPGLQDITAHVDFSAISHAADGLELLSYTSQAAFLLQAGIGDLLLRNSPSDPIRYLPQANALQKLVSPAEMGELFKVLVMGLGVDLPEQFLHHNRQHRL